MNKKVLAALAALVLPAAGIAAEEGFKFGASNSNMNYTYVQGGFMDVDYGTGLALEGSYQFHDKFFVFGQFEDVSDDPVSQSLLAVGAGTSLALNDKFDVYGKAGFYSYEMEVDLPEECFPGIGCFGGGGESWDDSGLGFEIGARGMVMPQVEVFGDFKFIMLDDSVTGFDLGARYWVNDRLGVSIALTDMEESDGLVLAARYEF